MFLHMNCSLFLTVRIYKAENNMSTINPLSANIAKWSNTLKQVVGKLLTNCLIVFDHFVRLAL